MRRVSALSALASLALLAGLAGGAPGGQLFVTEYTANKIARVAVG